MTPIERRIASLEAARRAKTKRAAPHVLFVGMMETRAEAFDRFNTEFPDRTTEVIVLPAKPKTLEERALYEERLHAQQTGLIADARRDRMAIVPETTPIASPKRWPSSPTIRPNGPHTDWKPQC